KMRISPFSRRAAGRPAIRFGDCTALILIYNYRRRPAISPGAAAIASVLNNVDREPLRTVPVATSMTARHRRGRRRSGSVPAPQAEPPAARFAVVAAKQRGDAAR